jgi:3-methylfumaryl-CoA hydratase
VTDTQPFAIDVASWIGRTLERRDVIDERLVAEFRATFSPHLAMAPAVPPGLHWCLAPEILGSDQIGRDGHAKLGIHLPDVGLERRMWAGGEMIQHGEFALGDIVSKTSTIEDIAAKSGKSGNLVFVKVRNRYSVRDALILEERQDIVYRQAAPPEPDIAPAAPTAPPDAPVIPPDSWSVTPSPVLLFRYSAMTFNGHRIHYDAPYARQVERYEGLVVHGPLQATLMLNLAVVRAGRLPGRFNFRGLAPLISDRPFSVTAIPRDGELETKVVSQAGIVTMSGTAA